MSAVALKSRPIIFTGESVRAILDGRKTQTRRVVKSQPPYRCYYKMNGNGTHALCLFDDDSLPDGLGFCPPTPTSTDHKLSCPYGQPGDLLWVRETLQRGVQKEFGEGLHGHTMQYRATITAVPFAEGAEIGYCGYAIWQWEGKKTCSSRFMPRWASRLTLEITNVRVEGLQEMNELDLALEGFTIHNPELTADAFVGFNSTWDALNAKRGYPWSENPWVWVISFKRVENA